MTFRTSYQKYGAKRTEYNGVRYDSKFEAQVAKDLDTMKQAGEIKDWERQFKIECVPYDAEGNPVPELKVTHKVDFRAHENDGTYTLIEAKGLELGNWKQKRKWLEHFWLPQHKDHDYRVIYNK